MIDKQVETGERDDAPSLSGVVSGIGSVEPSPQPCDQTTQKPPKDTLHPKSEQVQSIIERMPTRHSYVAAIVVVFLVGIIITLGFIIKYPETIDGTVSITAQNAPVRLVTPTNGRLILLCNEQDTVSRGCLLAYIESGASYEDITILKEILANYSFAVDSTKVPDSLILGELSQAYSRFVLLHNQYSRFMRDNIYRPLQENIKKQIGFDQGILRNIDHEISLKNKILAISTEQQYKDSILVTGKSISEAEYNRRLTSHLANLSSMQSLRNSRASTLSRISSADVELSKINVEKSEKEAELMVSLVTARDELVSSLGSWQQKYEIVTPIDGILEFHSFWRPNAFVQAGAELFSVSPNMDELIGEVVIPAFGAGKIKKGYDVNIKLHDFPFDEYGTIKAKVATIGKLSNTTQTEQGTTVSYKVNVYFPDGLTTNFGMELTPNFETKGIAEILIKPKRLIYRLFDNLKSAVKN